ncbi:MAG: hypothetical protein JXJ18_13930 [Rhodobacteraceae bacterium]|nr:hypothetical protein [Paracoccaceae bacterium]
MTSWMRMALAGGMMALMAVSAQAQEESTNNVAVKTDWNVFVEDDPTECWGVSPPKQTVNTKEGRVVSVRRGEILLFITFRPGAGVAGEVSFTGGYPFAKDSTVKMQVGDDSYDLFTDGEWAWPASKADDAKIIASMKRGAEAVLTGRSGRGTQTQDTFSLLGFTAAMEEAERRCGGN